ncbi:ATP-binding protein [Rhizobium sp. L1K21]|uniref:ATP-binding protein n=1 Tax=Rhizobium sp. L1K21 TaxID=2954933 RepID=UPI0020937A32|nr:ATP-binding protein [Rhizobium sp. L1K21]MCO6185479.1 ATP-binding protein [Rhizobium sp. L1K21]
MTVFETIRGDNDKPSKSRLRNFIRWLRRQLPTGLYARTLLIIILPMVILQAVVGYVFMERHWQLVTQRLSESVTRDIAAIIEIVQTYPQDSTYGDIVRIARDQLDLNITIEQDDKLPPPGPKPFFSLLDQTLSQEIANQIQRPFWIDTVGNSQLVEIRILLEGKVLRVFAPRSAAYASNSGIFLMWMTGTSLVLIGIAILFLRNQIRPILALAKAAESFGKGQKMPEGFAPRGADEVRKASLAFILMRERIERQIEQRTAMLSGVSHDLRTILTRFKLQLALAGDNPEFDALNKDVEDMQMMLQGYLDFARGESEEDYGEVSLKELFQRLEMEAELQGKSFRGEFDGDDELKVRPNAFNRLVSNLSSNAWRHADTLEVSARHSAKWLTLTFDDNGPGIPEDRREDVFKPFFRLDEARNLNASGTGLGLAIVRDIARGHGGSVALSDSALGGLRVTVRIPA